MPLTLIASRVSCQHVTRVLSATVNYIYSSCQRMSQTVLIQWTVLL